MEKKTRLRLIKTTLALAALCGALVVYNFLVPDIARLRGENPGKTAFMLRSEAKAKGNKLKIRQQWVPMKRISPYLVEAVLIAEDDKFWMHEGFDFAAIKEALMRDIGEGRAKFGGSTISQQLVKNLWLSPSRNPLRKLREAFLTWRLERELSKKRILEIYLNVVEWGDGIYGAEAASRHYFGKPASDLWPEEACRLAVVLPNPRRYNPLADTKFIEGRWREVYGIMLKRMDDRDWSAPGSQGPGFN